MDEAVSGGGAEVSQRAGETSSKTGQAEERLCLGGRQPLNTHPVTFSVLWPSLCGFLHVSRPAVGQAFVCVFVCLLLFLSVSRLHISASHCCVGLFESRRFRASSRA